MKILLVGASGFIGSAIAAALLAEGHELRAAGRDLDHGRKILPGAQWVSCELRHMASKRDWQTLLREIEIVINASGALQDGLRDDLALVQERAICTLAEASAEAGVRQFIHLSAADVDRQQSRFMQTKARAEAAIAASGVRFIILRPGLVIGRNSFGGSELLRVAAAAPLVAIGISGTGPIQCVALDDVVAAVREIVARPEIESATIDLVEREPRSLGEVIASHRIWLGLAPARFALRIPLALLKPVTIMADSLGWLGWRSPLRTNAAAALVHGVRGNADQTTDLLGRAPLSLSETFASLGAAGKADRWHARLAGLYPFALMALIVLWLAGGLIGLARADAAATLLVEGGVSGSTAHLLVVLGSLADLAIAAGILFRPALRFALGGGAVLALAYAIGAAVVRPDLWLDPLGAMVKILPVIALSLLCLAMAGER